MKFMTMVTTANPDKAGPPPPELYQAIAELGVRAGEFSHVGVRADGEDFVARDGQGFGGGEGAVDGDDLAAVEDQRGVGGAGRGEKKSEKKEAGKSSGSCSSSRLQPGRWHLVEEG